MKDSVKWIPLRLKLNATKLSFAGIPIAKGHVLREVDEHAAVPRGKIRFQVKPHTSWIIFSKYFSEK